MKTNFIKAFILGAILTGSFAEAKAQTGFGSILESMAGGNTGQDIISGLTSIFSNNKVATADKLVGTWVYEEPAIVFESSNLLQKAGGTIVSSRIEKRLQTVLAKYGIKKGNGSIVPVSNYSRQWNMPKVLPDGRTYGTYDQNPTLTISYPFPQGINVIYPIYSSDTKNWHVCSFYNNQPFIINVDATKLTPVTTPLAATVTAEDGLYTGMTNPMTVTFTNSMDMEFNGLVNIYTNTKDNTKPSSPDFDLYITIPARGSVTRQIELPETSSSQQYLWITDVANKEAAIVNGQLFTLTTAAAPNFTVVSSESNATPGKFGEGICYSAKCKLPLVEDDKLVVRFGVKNTGGPGYLD